MKPFTRVYLSGDEVHAPDINLVLEMSTCGRGFITAQTETDYTGQLVRVDTGYPGLLLRWFTGYVERSQVAGNGFRRLYVRELAGVLEKPWPCSFQHPDINTVTAWLAEKTGLEITTPDAPYTALKIPHFTHSGNGFQLLNSLGAAFSINDYAWYQLPDGGLYAGGMEKSLFAGRPVEIPAEFSEAAAAGNSMTIPMVQTLRPGVEVNGQRLTKVTLRNDLMDITWIPRDARTGKPSAKTSLQRQIENIYPELASGLHAPKFARVLGPVENVASGDFADPFRPRYAVNIQLLDADGKPDGDTPVYHAVPLPVPMAGNDSGMFQFPPEGTLVEVGFTGGRPDKPFVRQTVPEGTSLPDVKPGEQLQQQRADVSQRVTQAGDWERKTDQTIRENSMTRHITADDETRDLVTREITVQATDKTTVLGVATLMAGGIQQISDGDYSQAVKRNSSCSIGGNLIERIGALRQSIAAARQEVKAPKVWVGSEDTNTLRLLTDTLDVIMELAKQTAAHTHPSVGTPTNAAAIAAAGSTAGQLKQKYSPNIA